MTVTTLAGDSLLYHGGDLAEARRRFPGAPEPWLDLSTGINAVPYPVGELAESAWTRLPDADAVRRLEAAAASAYGAPDAGLVVAAPGTQALIQILPRVHAARRVAILGFTYGEHAAAWRAAGAEVATVERVEDLIDADAAVIVTPNNPDGRVVGAGDLAVLAGALGARGGLLVVDEAFADIAPGVANLAPQLPPGAVVLRSFGKTYGLAGLRLGFAVAREPLGSRLRAALGPWAVSGPALEIGARALADRDWLAATARRLAGDVARLDGLLERAGLAIVGGTPLFRLASHSRAFALFEALGRQGVLTRPFAARPHWLRFGLPGGDEAWRLLEERLAGAAREVGP